MGTYSVSFYGVSISDAYGDLPEEIQEKISEQRGKKDGWAREFYDGNASPPVMAFIGVEVPRGTKGIVVTEEIEAAAVKAYANCPEDVRLAVCEALRVAELPEPRFVTEEGWG